MRGSCLSFPLVGASEVRFHSRGTISVSKTGAFVVGNPRPLLWQPLKIDRIVREESADVRYVRKYCSPSPPVPSPRRAAFSPQLGVEATANHNGVCEAEDSSERRVSQA